MSEVDIFNLDDEMFLDEEPQGNDSEFYKPYPEKGKDGVYESIIRFLPNPVDPRKSKIKKYCVYLEGEDGKSYPVDCPSTVKQKSILKDMFWKLKNSNSAAEQELSKKFSRKEECYSLIQVVEDKNNPDLEGKILIYKFGNKVNDKITDQLKPTRGAKVNPFDVFSAREFSLQVRKVSGWNNYDLCKFVGDPCPITIEGEQIEKSPEGMERVNEYLKGAPQNLTNFEYKPWNDETYNKVLDYIKATVPNGRIVNEVVAGAGSSTGSSSPSVSTPPQAKKSSSSETHNFHDEVSQTNVGSQPEEIEEKEEAQTEDTPAMGGSLDELYENL